jgi:hypothetical protein
MAFSVLHGMESEERMRITADGNVGIGTDSPKCALAVGSEHTPDWDATSAIVSYGFEVRSPGDAVFDLNSHHPTAATNWRFMNRTSSGNTEAPAGSLMFQNTLGQGTGTPAGTVMFITPAGNVTGAGVAFSMAFDADNLDNVRASEASGLDNINNLVVSDFEKDGVAKTGIVAQNMQKILPNSVSGGEEYEAVVEPAKGMVVANLGTKNEYVYDNHTSVEVYEAARGKIPGDAKFVETDAEKTETRNHSLATSNDELIAMLVKAVQELSAKNDELSAELNELKSK